MRATSLAARPTPSRAAEERRTLLHAYVAHNGLTDDEAEAETGITGNSLRWRRKELIQSGHVAEGKEKRKTRSGKWALVWVPTIFAYAEVLP